jgi:alpha-glucosidase
VLTHGRIEAVGAWGNILRYERCQGDERLAVVLNLGHEQERVGGLSGQVLLSTYSDRVGEDVAEGVSLRADEGIIVQAKSESVKPAG